MENILEVLEILEQLDISEECLNSVLDIIEAAIDEDADSKYKGFNSTMNQEDSKAITKSIEQQIAKDEAKIAKKPNKSAAKRIANNKEWLQAHQKFQQSGKKTPFEGGKIGELTESIIGKAYTIAEAILNETKKANKEAHQEAVFKKLNPDGVPVWGFVEKDRKLTDKDFGAINRLKNIGSDKISGDSKGTTHSIKDYRTLMDTDREDNAPEYDYDSRKVEPSPQGSLVRKYLGRDGKFANTPPEPSKSSKAGKAYADYKKLVRKLKKK